MFLNISLLVKDIHIKDNDKHKQKQKLHDKLYNRALFFDDNHITVTASVNDMKYIIGIQFY